MKTHLASVARIVAIAAVAICLSPPVGNSAEIGSVGASIQIGPFEVKSLPFPTTATFKHWTSATGTTRVCKGRCGPHHGSASPYYGTALYGSRYVSVPINSSATFVLKEAKAAVAFIWGTPDTNCNVADFYDSTGSLIGEIDASEIPGAGYYKIKSTTPIGSIVFSEGNCGGDVYFEIAQGPFPYRHGAISY